jgi:hypothetical protein
MNFYFALGAANRVMPGRNNGFWFSALIDNLRFAFRLAFQPLDLRAALKIGSVFVYVLFYNKQSKSQK